MRFLLSVVFLLFLSGIVSATDGTVFLEGDRVQAPRPDMPKSSSGSWKVLDDQLTCVASGVWSESDKMIVVGALPVGWYRIEFLDANNTVQSFTTAAVLKPLAVPPPSDTPIAVDIAMSWVPEKDPEVWEQCAQLAKMAGVAMVRDRIRWRDMQPEKDAPMVQDTVYDQTACLQQEQGLQVLQVFHDSPSWAWVREEERGRVPADLRDTWRFCRDVAAHFGNQVQAWQPWNEGNAGNFGGHAIDELCSHQKAAFLGFRAGNPQATVCWGPLGGINSAGLAKGVIDNKVAAYFDVYSMHSYDWSHDYPRLRQHALEAAAGKPLWVTESDRGMNADSDSPHGDFTHEDERRKATFITQSIVSSLAAGANRHFHFILPQYMEQEHKVQFGLLRPDQTPRMGYVTLAAAGRLLAGAHYLGRLYDADRPDIYTFAFRAQPDGVAQEVLVAWTEGPFDWPQRGNASAAWSLPDGISPTTVWDYLGRSIETTSVKEISSTPVYILLPEGTVSVLNLQTPPVTANQDYGTPSPVVLQLRASDVPNQGRVVDWAHEHDRAMNPGEHDITIAAYHFGENTAEGRITLKELPNGWKCNPDTWDVTLGPLERHEMLIHLTIPEPGPPAEEGAWIKFEGNFGNSNKPCLAFRVMPTSK